MPGNPDLLSSFGRRFAAAMFACALVPPVFGSGVEPVSVLEEDADVVLYAPDLPALSAGFRESAFAELWENPDLRAFFAPLSSAAGNGDAAEIFVRETREHWERFGDFFDGGVAAAISLPRFDPESGFEGLAELGRKERWAVAGEFSGTDEDLAEFLEPFSDLNPKNQLPGHEAFSYEEDFLGHTLVVEEVETADGELLRRNGYALVDGTMVVAHPLEYLRDAVARIVDRGEGGALDSREEFLDLRDRTGGDHLTLFVDLEAVAGLVGAGIGAAFSGSREETNPLGLTAEGITGGLGLAELRTFHLSARFGAERSVMRGGVAYAEKKGLLRLLSYGEGPPPRPPLVPDDPVSTSVGRMEWMDTWVGLKEMLGEISPGLRAMLEMTRSNFQRQAGLDFEQDLIGNLGGETVTYTARRVGPPGSADSLAGVDSVFALELVDPSGFVLALEGLKDAFGLRPRFAEREFEGTTIHVFEQPIPGDPGAFFSYAVAGDRFLLGIGSKGLVEGVVSRIARGSGGFWNRPEVADLLAELPEGAVGASFSDLGHFVDDLVEMLAVMKEMAPEGGGPSVDPAERPEGVVFPYFVFSGQAPEENGFYFESIVLPLERLDP